jgi:alanine racemase
MATSLKPRGTPQSGARQNGARHFSKIVPGTDLSPVVHPSAPAWIEVDLAAIRYNLQQVRQFLGQGVQVLAVVKANAYGHGLVPVARALVEAGADLLAVASVTEGVLLRQQEITAKIFVLGQLLPEEAPLVVRHGLTQAIGDETVARALSRAAIEQEKAVSVHLKVDTGMGRYGVWFEEAVPLCRRLVQFPAIQLEGIFTHLASAGQNTGDTEEQLDRFRQVVGRLTKAKLPSGIKHVANSVGLIRFPNSHWDLVRTGLLVYGASPLKEGRLPLRLKPALTLKSRIRFLKTIPAGATVSYGGTFRATRPTQVATIPVGYAHGYTRALSDKASLLVRGTRAPVVGRITMEDLMADVTDIPAVQVGDEVVLVGPQGKDRITAEELARHARTIPYEILAGLSPSIPRRCRD